MANDFEVAVANSSFKLCDMKEKDLVAKLELADEFCTYINKFLPMQLTKNMEMDDQNNDEENEEVSEDKDHPLKAFRKTTRAKTIEELHNRIEKLRGKKKITYKEKMLKKGLKNRIKKKQKLEERKQLKNASRKQDKNEEEEPQDSKDPSITERKSNEDISEPSYQFNKIVLTSDSDKKQRSTDPKRLLQQLEKKNKKLQKLEVKGKKDKLREIKNKETWNMAIQKAEGVKVKDNVELLKKSVQKIKQRKVKSKKKWEEREKQVETKKEEAQKKRQDNIMKKKKERSKKRTKALIKKGRILPR